MLRPIRFLSLSCLLPVLALAQSGDKRGEEQKPLSPHIVVPPAPVLTPEKERATFKLAPGFRAELVAADPLIGDPIAMQFGPDGRLWVLEMRGYMPNVDGQGEREPVGAVAVLTDTDNDGRYDRRTVFADQLIMARAISLVGDGLLVAEPPHLWFMRDTNGDGVADEKKEIANDYGNINNPEHNANGLMWAMDNWIYSANYTTRFRWQGDGRFTREPTITRGQWGITQDDYGRLYYNTNSDPLRVDLIPSAYLRRNRAFPATGTNVKATTGNMRIWPSRVTPGVNRGYRTLNEEAKITSMTAASGPVIYRGTLFPEEFRGDAFVPEPSGNLISRIKLTENNGMLTGKNAYEGTEFMTSTDERFRPVNLYNGPDGALYVVDFYRGILQHRTYVTSFLRKQIEERGLEKGIHYGRIWRIVPDGAPKANFQLTLARASVPQLVEKLADANGWVRDTVQRLLVEKRDAATVPLLRALARKADAPPAARWQALWTLDGIGDDALDRGTLLAALGDANARVVATAVRLSEGLLKQAKPDAELLGRLAELVKTRREPEVRLQLALSLTESRAPEAEDALRDLIIIAGNQPLLADAVVSGLAGRENEFIETLIRRPIAAAERSADVLRFATSAILKTGDPKRIDRVMGVIASNVTPDWAQIPLLSGVRHFLPKSPDGNPFPATIPAEPKPLVDLAARKDSPAAPIAQQLLTHLRWPGKPGVIRQPPRPLTVAEQALFDKGKAQFTTLCAACHQPNGQGLAGLAPSLIHSRWVLGDPRILVRIILNGKSSDNLMMPPWKAALDDENIAAVATFIRRSWEHDADPVAPAIVTEARRDTATREELWSDADLQELQLSLEPMRRGRRGPPR